MRFALDVDGGLESRGLESGGLESVGQESGGQESADPDAGRVVRLLSQPGSRGGEAGDSPAPAAGEGFGAEWAGLFEPGDPRAGPFSEQDRERSEDLAARKGRWHERRRLVDWMAVRLQHGRGARIADLVAMFGTSDSSIYQRVRKEGWVAPTSERDRRDLAKWVWLAGIERVAMDEEASRQALMAASDWRLIEPKREEVWELMDKDGEPVPMRINLPDRD